MKDIQYEEELIKHKIDLKLEEILTIENILNLNTVLYQFKIILARTLIYGKFKRSLRQPSQPEVSTQPFVLIVTKKVIGTQKLNNSSIRNSRKFQQR